MFLIVSAVPLKCFASGGCGGSAIRDSAVWVIQMYASTESGTEYRNGLKAAGRALLHGAFTASI